MSVLGSNSSPLVSTETTPAVPGRLNPIGNWCGRVIGGITSGIGEAASKVTEAFSATYQVIKNPHRTVSSYAADKLTDILCSIETKQPIATAIENVLRPLDPPGVNPSSSTSGASKISVKIKKIIDEIQEQASLSIRDKFSKWEEFRSSEEGIDWIEKQKESFLLKINGLYDDMTSEEAEEYLNNLVKHAVKGPFLERLEGERLTHVEAVLGEQNKQHVDRLNKYIFKFFDEFALEQCKAMPSERCLVVDLAKSSGAETAEKSGEKLTFLSSTQEIISAIESQKYSYLYRADIIPGKSIWIRRERNKVEIELKEMMMLVFCRLKETLKKRNASYQGSFEASVLGEAFTTLAGHFDNFTQYVNRGGLVQERLDDAMPYDWRMQAEVIRKAPLEAQGDRLAHYLYKLIFPTLDEIPVKVLYKRPLDLILPKVLGLVITVITEACASPQVMNKMLLNILKLLPTPEQLEAMNVQEERAEAQGVGQVVDVDPILRRDAGKLITTMLEFGSPLFSQLFNTGKGVAALAGKDNFETEVQDVLGDLVGRCLMQWLEQFTDTDQLFDWLMDCLDENFTTEALKPEDPFAVQKERAEEEELKQLVASTASNLMPYLQRTGKQAIMDVGKKLLLGSSPAQNIREGGVKEVRTRIGMIVANIFRFIGAAFAVVVEAFNYLTGASYGSKRKQKEAQQDAALFVNLMHSKKHQELISRLMELAVCRICNKALPQ